MEYLQLMGIKNNDITSWDFESIKAELEEKLKLYENIVYTEENQKEAKKDKAELSRLEKDINVCARAYKEKCLEPYNRINIEVKEITNIISNYKGVIDIAVKEFDNKRKESKKAEIKAYYDKKSYNLGNLAEKLFEPVFSLHPKWLNITTSQKQWQEDVLSAINKADSEIKAIKDMNTPYETSLLDVYCRSMSFDEVLKKKEEYTQVTDRAGLDMTAPLPEKTDNNKRSADSEEGTVLRIYATQKQLGKICDFMQAIGVKYDFL